jgi:hypothetical protein
VSRGQPLNSAFLSIRQNERQSRTHINRLPAYHPFGGMMMAEMREMPLLVFILLVIAIIGAWNLLARHVAAKHRNSTLGQALGAAY